MSTQGGEVGAPSRTEPSAARHSDDRHDSGILCRAYRPSPDVVFNRVQGQGVVVHLTTDRIFQLNQTGTRLWDLLAERVAPTEAQWTLQQEFDVEPGQLRAEITAMIGALLHERLIEPVALDEPAGGTS